MRAPTAVFVWWIVIFNSSSFGVANKTANEEEPKCKTLFTFGYGYRQFFHLSPVNGRGRSGSGDWLSVQFSVKARSDAHVLLSPSSAPEETDPVYEIVLGAGKNSFSDIRRSRRADTKSTAFTKDILSGTEMRGFWVKMNSEGLIKVGREGEDLPFIHWQDPDPLYVQYFSFCTWSGVAGKWNYDCPSNNQQDLVPVQPHLTDLDKLRQLLLPNYDVYSRPVSNSSQPMQINLQIETNHVMIDTKKSAMTIHCVLTLTWCDEKMVWNPKSFNNISVLHLVHHEIWQPELIVFNGMDKDSQLVKGGGRAVRVRADGQVLWMTSSQLTTRCLLSLQRWPRDTQICSIQLGFWNHHQLILLENGTELKLQRAGQEWEVQRMTSESVIVQLPWRLDSTAFTSDDDDSDYESEALPPSGLRLEFTLKRVNSGHYYVTIIPLIVMVVMSLTCFWMDPLGVEKLATNCLLVLLLSGWLMSLASALPAPPDHTPYLLKAYSWALAMQACVTVVTVFITSMVHKTRYCCRLPPRLLTSTLKAPFVVTLFSLPKATAKELEYGDLTEDEELGDADLAWRVVATFCDRIAFLFTLIVYTAIFLG